MNNTKLVYPDKTEIQKEYNLKYKELFLQANNLKVGDEIICNFEYETIHPKYKSREMEKFTHRKPGKGILKQDENGYLYAESIDMNTFYIWESSRTKRGSYRMVQKKSICKFYNSFYF